MAYPSFSKTGMTTLTFSKGDVFPSERTEALRQIVSESEAGLVRIATLSPPVTYIHLAFQRQPLADYTALRAWVRHALIRGRAYTFTYTDSAGTATTVRWWQDTFQMPQVAFELYDADILLRAETVAW